MSNARPTHRAEYESTQDWAIAEAPTPCPCFSCESDMGTYDCALRRQYSASWSPGAGLTVQIREREGHELGVSERPMYGEAWCVERWGKAFVDAVCADLEHRHWHLIYQSGDDFGSLPADFPAEYMARPMSCYLDSADYWPERVTWRKPPMRSPLTRGEDGEHAARQMGGDGYWDRVDRQIDDAKESA